MTCVEVMAVDMLVRLLRDELRLGWKEDDRRQQQGTEPKSCDLVGQFSSSLQSVQEVKEIHILFDQFVSCPQLFLIMTLQSTKACTCSQFSAAYRSLEQPCPSQPT